MIKDITLGQYFPGSSVVHNLDARFKLVITLLFIIMLFIGGNTICLEVGTVLRQRRCCALLYRLK